ncbi:monocopper oxidase-like protein SKU5 isoform X1 [Ananas comosus]|uniref:Monocopper oxidase-like protein SKU5 isoform X1 n=1 Tax=Ananas comosus TaxID=4615 RepID=A0A6P5EQU3_ANACO|nr:monocopper oxidase-like protein SKU5 isoform X1 [Ananas comosus]
MSATRSAPAPTSTALAVFASLLLLVGPTSAGDPYAYFDWDVSYVSAAPLGVKQQVIGVNGQFPGPIVNVSTNWNVVVNVLNDLDEPLLITWNGIQHRKNCWQDGVLGTNCPIPSGWNWTYQFQVKDQIGSFFYFPSLNFHRAAGGYGGIIVNNRDVIAVPFDKPDGDFTVFIGDWYNKDHKDLRKALDDGKSLGMPDGVLINGKGPYRYNKTLVPAGIDYETINVHPGRTYRFRVHNVGISTSLNLRIQNHNMLLVETEGSYTVQQNYTNLDIHVGQSYSFLVTMDQNASSDYYIVASARFVNESLWRRVTGVAILRYSNSRGKASGPLPDPPQDLYDKTYSMNQARSIRWNLSAGAARPNPQGSFRYASINVTQQYLLRNEPPVMINGERRATLNGISYSPPETPLRLADQYTVKGVYTLDFPTRPLKGSPKLARSVINGTYRGFMEIIFQNNDTNVQTYHMDGYAFFVVGMDYGEWTEDSRGTYNKGDGVARCTTQVFPGAWTAILVSLDNVGIWNVRAQNLDTWYLGQEVYVRVVNPEDTNKTELPIPGNALYCGLLQKYQKEQVPHHRVKSSSGIIYAEGKFVILMLFLVAIATFT